MLIEGIKNPWYLFRTLQIELSAGEKRELAKKAFLYVTGNYNAFNYQKKRALDEIVEACPDVLITLSDKEMLESFRRLYQENEKKGEILSPTELDWTNKYIKSSHIRIEIERSIYRRLLSCSSHWDRLRKSFAWRILYQEKLKLVDEVLQDGRVDSKRKIELAQEFGKPKEGYVLAYYKKLLFDRNYDEAEGLNVNNPDIVFEVIVANINNGYFQEALDVVLIFLPERKDIAEEIRKIRNIFQR